MSIFQGCKIFYLSSYLGLVSPMDFEYKYNKKTYENEAWLCIYKRHERSPSLGSDLKIHSLLKKSNRGRIRELIYDPENYDY